MKPTTPEPTDAAIEAVGLVKSFGRTRALDGLDLRLERGTVLGVLGPNGAGKTTAVRILTTLLEPDAGHATVTGLDVVRQAELVRYRIGLAGQQAAVDELLTGRANLEMVGRLYHLKAKAARRRADELLERFGLTEAASRLAKTYSGGMRRRLDLAASLVVAPPVIFLDEPTTGLDPRSRTDMWDVIGELVAGGASVLLTTQYLDEADRLADRIVVIDGGRAIAEGTADELKRRIGADRIDVVVRDADRLGDAATVLGRVAGKEPTVHRGERRVEVTVQDIVEALSNALNELQRAGVAIEDIAVARPTLDDVFLRLTGRRHEDSNDEEEAAA